MSGCGRTLFGGEFHKAAAAALMRYEARDAGAGAALYVAGAPRWHALKVRPQREDEAEAWLRLRGVYGFHPVRLRRVRRKGRVHEYERRYLPGYVFARFPGKPLVHQVMVCPFIIGAICRAGGEEWGVLAPRALRAIHAMRKIDSARKEKRAEVRSRRATFRPGEAAMFRSGPLDGVPCEVVALRADGNVEVRLTLLARDVTTLADPRTLTRGEIAA